MALPLLNPPQLYLDSEMAAGEMTYFAGGIAAIYSARSPGKLSPNEDAAALLPYDEQSGVLVVADGMGGGRLGDEASRRAIEALAASIEAASMEGHSRRGAILDGLEQANASILELGQGAGTTLAAVEFDGTAVRPYHVGDSMILVVGGRGKLKLQTVSHSPVGFAVEAGLLDANEALHHEDRHLISNSLGAADMRIEIGSARTLSPRDTLLIASDGLFDNLSVEEIADRVRKGPLHQAVSRLAADATKRMLNSVEGMPSKPDDLTVVAFRLG